MWLTRPRYAAEPVTGAQVRINQGVFGAATPYANASAEVNPFAVPHIYRFHEGDLFTPGTGNWVFESGFELPLNTIWGFGFLGPNKAPFDPRQPPQIVALPRVIPNGIGGIQAGQFNFQPLVAPTFLESGGA